MVISKNNLFVYLGIIFILNNCTQSKSPQNQTSKQKQCKNLINGVVTPLRDLVTFIDTEYTEVTLINRNNWDKKRLPKKVIQLQTKKYRCNPIPEEFGNIFNEPGILAQPAVKTIRWNCELAYEKYKYLKSNQTNEKKSLLKEGCKCVPVECLDLKDEDFIWFCHK